MGVSRSPLPRHWFLVLGLTGFVFISVLLSLGTQHQDKLRKLVPTVSWQATGCAGREMIHELEDKWGKTAMRMSLAHGGSGARLARVLRRLKENKKIAIGAVGGSITHGHGLSDGDKRWSVLLEEGLQRVYPDCEVAVHNGAVPATGSDYFASCYEHHVPKDSDLFIIEAAVNDLLVEVLTVDGDRTPDIIDYTERLVREMRMAPSEPALMMLSTWIVPSDYASGADRHAVVSEYYDIPRISMRSFLYPYLSQHQDELPLFFGNTSMDHPIQLGHEYLADILLYHILTQDCLTQDMGSVPLEPYPDLGGYKLQSSLEAYGIPPLRVKQRLDNEPYTNPQPVCLSANVRLEGDTSQLQPSEQTGWEETFWNNKHYWTSTTPGAKITFSDIDVHGGKLSIYYLRGSNLGLGNMRCWADNDYDRAVKLQGFWTYVNVGSAGFITKGLQPGKHSVTCEVMDETEDHNGVEGTHRCSIIAVMAS